MLSYILVLKGLSEEGTFYRKLIIGRNEPRTRVGIFLAEVLIRAYVFCCRDGLGLWQEQGIDS